MHNPRQKQIDLGDIESVVRNQGYRAICGVDEAGRGPLAGPVVAAAVILPDGITIAGLADSKKLSSSRRDELFEEIASLNLPCAIGIIDHEAIDTMNILRASLMAMHNAVIDLKQAPDVVLVDGTFTIPNLIHPQYAIVGGDNRCRSVMAASIVAKVTRDRIMDEYQQLYPAFSFSVHKGYPTALHLRELEHHGPCAIHRKSFKPVARVIAEYALI